MGYLYWNMNGPITGIVPLGFLWEYVMIEFIGTGFFSAPVGRSPHVLFSKITMLVGYPLVI